MSFITIVEDNERIPKKFGESIIWYRRYSSAVHSRLQKEFRKPKKNRQGESYNLVDEDGLNKAILDYIIVDLEKVKDGKGGFIETTIKNKLRLPGDVIEIIMGESGAASIRGGTEDEDPPQPVSENT